MAAKMSITFKMGSTMDLLGVIDKQIFPYMNQAVDVVGKQVAARWTEAVMKAKLWSGEKDQYAQSISWKMTGDFSGYVEATYKYAKEIEEGRPARDLKRMLGTSLKVRRTTKGKTFLVIPFRHNLADMPPALQQQAKALVASKVIGMGQRKTMQLTALSPKFGMKSLPDPLNIQKTMVAQAQYAWGGRLKGDKAAHTTGMVRMNTGKSSAFLTFRTMMEGQKGWVVPSQPGQWIARDVVAKIAPEAEKLFQKAMALDVKKG